ncbi:hypothetical protein [Cloacibacillus sp. An23]|uniref:hypothetical protein n=1 Tax=Cloacibacillus sp. An23 TaxID=1965591 RepID=UPI001177FB7D|nr:hypothetical protein [Cloacibacillus sp. An23]
MTILERLQDAPRQPRRMATNRRREECYEATKELLPQIIEAKEYGYTWHSIRNMVEQILRERGIWRKHWDNWDIQANYYRLMKEAKQQ